MQPSDTFFAAAPRLTVGRRRILRALAGLAVLGLGLVAAPAVSQAWTVYNFTDDPAPKLALTEDAAGDLILADGNTQGDLLTSAFSGTAVTVTLKARTVDSVSWSGGTGGVLPVPAVGVEETHAFTYEVSQPSTGNASTGTGQFKIKRTNSPGG